MQEAIATAREAGCYKLIAREHVKIAAHQWLLSEPTDPAHTLVLNWVECQFQIADLYENVEFGN